MQASRARLTRMGDAQDAMTWWQRNKVEEGGGGYLGYGWDSAIWGVNVQLAALTNNSAPQWAAEARTSASVPPGEVDIMACWSLQSVVPLWACGAVSGAWRELTAACFVRRGRNASRFPQCSLASLRTDRLI